MGTEIVLGLSITISWVHPTTVCAWQIAQQRQANVRATHEERRTDEGFSTASARVVGRGPCAAARHVTDRAGEAARVAIPAVVAVKWRRASVACRANRRSGSSAKRLVRALSRVGAAVGDTARAHACVIGRTEAREEHQVLRLVHHVHHSAVPVHLGKDCACGGACTQQRSPRFRSQPRLAWRHQHGRAWHRSAALPRGLVLQTQVVW
eukprot:SAG11_NODE_1616_length_4577_cov_1.568781_5_plen_208_part_00